MTIWIAATAMAGQASAARFPNGDRASVVALFGGEFRNAWGPSGQVLKASQLPSALEGIPLPTVRHLREIAVRVETGSAAAPAVAIRVGNGPARSAQPVRAVRTIGKRHIWLAVGEANSDDDAAPVHVGIGTGTWKTLGTATRHGGAMTRSGFGFMKVTRPWEYVAPGHAKLDIVISDVALPTDTEGYIYRVQLLTGTGKLLPLHHIETDAAGTHEWFVGKYADVAKAVLQSRPLAWSTFMGVRMKPR